MRVESSGAESPNELKAMVAENLKLTKDLAHSVKKIRRYIFVAQLTGWIKFILIVVPLVLAAIYLQPLIKNAMATYNQLLGASGTINSLTKPQGGMNVGDLLNSPQVQEFLKQQQK